ncbi:MAG: bromoperoxidase [Pseudomonadota bacterium]
MTQDRRQAAYTVRVEAAELAQNRPHPLHLANGDEQRFASANYAMSFTKGLKHSDVHGLVANAADFKLFRTAIDNAFIEPFTANVRGVMDAGRPWEAPTAGVVYDLEGPDAQAVTMDPAPPMGSDELDYEMAEVYWLAILRDCPLTYLAGPADFQRFNPAFDSTDPDQRACRRLVRDARNHLNSLDYAPDGETGRPRLTNEAGNVTRGTVFRGSSPAVEVGPYLSQFLLIGNADQIAPAAVVPHAQNTPVADGRITYGALQIDQRVPVSPASTIEGFNTDFMTSRPSWLAVQDGADARCNVTLFDAAQPRRFMLTPRDLATYVHDDALYEAYLNAALILLAMGTPFDPGFDALSGGGAYSHNTGPVPANQDPDSNSTNFPRKAGGFALYGGPHILTLVTEVATRALKAVRFQKFNNHLRLRPEALAARVEYADEIEASFPATAGLFTGMRDRLDAAPGPVRSPTGIINTATGTRLLPMAFQEGSPMHPSYGAGHATVAGACVTILKAFFDTGTLFVRRDLPANPGCEPARSVDIFHRYQPGDLPVTYVPDGTGATLLQVATEGDAFLTLEGELNKLAANISIGRNMAGVHFYTDYYDSVRMGEEIAIGMLEEQALCYPTDPFVLSLPTFDGEIRRIGRR